jgi:hypothetical protein
MKWTDPSAKATLTPPAWKLLGGALPRAVASSRTPQRRQPAVASSLWSAAACRRSLTPGACRYQPSEITSRLRAVSSKATDGRKRDVIFVPFLRRHPSGAIVRKRTNFVTGISQTKWWLIP